MARQGLLRSLQLLKGVQQQQAASFAAAAGAKPRKVAVLGAAGGIGQPLSMLMKASAAPGVWGARERGRVRRSKPFPSGVVCPRSGACQIWRERGQADARQAHTLDADTRLEWVRRRRRQARARARVCARVSWRPPARSGARHPPPPPTRQPRFPAFPALPPPPPKTHNPHR